MAMDAYDYMSQNGQGWFDTISAEGDGLEPGQCTQITPRFDDKMTVTLEIEAAIMRQVIRIAAQRDESPEDVLIRVVEAEFIDSLPE